MYKKIPTLSKASEKKAMIKDVKQQWKDAGVLKQIPEWFMGQLTAAGSASP